MVDKEAVAVFGAGGTMGLPIARNLARSGFAVRAWNRSREKAEPLIDDGVQVYDTPAQAAEGATIVVTMLSAVDAVIDSIQAALPGASGIWLQMSTIGEIGTDRCIELAQENQLTSSTRQC